MTTLAILNQKGGVGKTTTALTLAHGAALRGIHTLLVDLDAQGNLAETLGISAWPGLFHLLIQRRADRARRATGRERLDLIASDKRTAEVELQLAGMTFRENALASRLRDYNHELIVLDVAPGLNILQINALVAADVYLVPTQLEHLAVDATAKALQSAAALLAAGNLKARLLGILPTFWDQRLTESRAQLAELARLYGALVWPPIPVDTLLSQSNAHGKTIWEYAPGARALQGAMITNGSGPHLVGGYAAALDRVLEEVGL